MHDDSTFNDDGPSPRLAVDAVITLLVWDAHEAVARLCDSLAEDVASRATWRLLILDQGSVEPTASMLADFARRSAPAVRLDRLDANVGYPAGHNRLHRLARERFDSRYLVTLNSDVVFDDRNWLDRLVDFMDAHADVGLAGPTGVTYERCPPHRLGWCRLSTPEEMRRSRFDSVSGSVCIIRQSMIEQIGLFDEAFTPGYYEDTDLAFRAKAAGWRIALCPVRHRHQDLGAGMSSSQIKSVELTARYGNFQKRNRNLFVDRWLTAPPRELDRAAVRQRFPTVYLPDMEPARC